MHCPHLKLVFAFSSEVGALTICLFSRPGVGVPYCFWDLLGHPVLTLQNPGNSAVLRHKNDYCDRERSATAPGYPDLAGSDAGELVENRETRVAPSFESSLVVFSSVRL
jgi:hypothetical protein